MQLDITCTVCVLKIICHLVITFKVGTIIAAILLAGAQQPPSRAAPRKAQRLPGLASVGCLIAGGRTDHLLASRGRAASGSSLTCPALADWRLAAAPSQNKPRRYRRDVLACASPCRRLKRGAIPAQPPPKPRVLIHRENQSWRRIIITVTIGRLGGLRAL